MASYADIVAHPSWVWTSSSPYPSFAPQICRACSNAGIAFPQALFLIAQALTHPDEEQRLDPMSIQVHSFPCTMSRALEVLKNPTSTIDEYAKTLQEAGHASAGQKYIDLMRSRYRAVTRDFVRMIEANQKAHALDFIDWGPGATADYSPVLVQMKEQAAAAVKATPPR